VGENLKRHGTYAAIALAVSGTTIHDWIRRKKIINIEKARLAAKLTGLELQQLRSTL
jgi:hypothetical protein